MAAGRGGPGVTGLSLQNVGLRAGRRAPASLDAVRAVLVRSLGFLVGLVLLGAIWEGYKAWGPAGGGHLLGMAILPRTDDTAMPHLWAIWDVLGQRQATGSQATLTFGASRTASSGGQTVLGALVGDCLVSLGWAAVGFVAGLLVGVALALALDRSRLIRRAALPYLVASQTVPLVALAPIFAQWDGSIHIGGWTWSNAESIERGALAEDRDASTAVWGLEVRYEPGFEPLTETLFDAGELLGEAVAGQDQLAP